MAICIVAEILCFPGDIMPILSQKQNEDADDEKALFYV
jgi:hypothetical protein